ncbi:kinase-like domain-containing protein [Mucidula mucida]|nr:kinase-like domain-containing protein [Mucidula mucida]
MAKEVDDSFHLDDGDYRKRTTKCLLFIAKVHGVVPTSFSCPDVRCQGKHAVWGGGFADIWKGQMNDETVCLKVLRIFLENGHVERKKMIKSFCSEALVWRNLNHPNVLPFIGVSKDLFYPSFCLISPWMNNGNIMAFLSQNPDHDRLHSVTEVAQGLAYLHALAPPIVHADIRGANILVTDDLKCCLADFGLALAVESQSPALSTTTLQGSIRWLAPEILDIRLFDPQYVTARDIYAFGCTILEMYTGKPPFSEIHSDAAIIHEILTRCKMPSQPPEDVFPSEMWDLTESCLAGSATERPSAHSILRILQEMV